MAEQPNVKETSQPEASIAIQVLPSAGGGDEVIHVVDKVIEYLKGTGLNAFVGPFETTIEGNFDKLWEAAKECQKICIREGAGSVSTYIKSFYNPKDGVWSIEKKTAKHRNNAVPDAPSAPNGRAGNGAL
ncbi:MAG: thiamine-binding protein [Treponema sp.]|jgi:uncharacterized protein YqgV (UPF0045/DUF77 family)|nr:thiamine-binding protein [Treponema sp.]